MPKLRYGVIGTGRWGTIIAGVLARMDREVQPIAMPRRAAGVSRDQYFGQVSERLATQAKDVDVDVDVLWVAVPPGNQAELVRAGLEQGCHIVCEKPWDVCPDTTQSLASMARDAGLISAVHYQYCYLAGLPEIVSDGTAIEGPLQFDAAFTISRANRLGLDPFSNMASHLLAIHHVHFPTAKIGTITAAYDSPDCRKVQLSSAYKTWTLDFTKNQEPLIETFIMDFEKCCLEGRPHQTDIAVASAISGRIAGYLS